MEVNTLLYSSLSILIFFLTCKFLMQTRSSLKKLPPSPLGLPILGHLHLIEEPLHRTLHTLSQKYGSIMSLKFGSHRVVVVSSPSAVEECFNKNDIVFANRPRLIMGRYLGYNHTILGLAPFGDHWRNLRRLSASEIFSSIRLNMFLETRSDEINILLRKLYSVSKHEFVKVELRPMFSELTLNIIMRMVAGKRYYGEEGTSSEEARQFRELIEEIFEYAVASHPSDFLPIFEWFDYQGYVKRAVRIGNKTDEFMQGLIDEHRIEGLENRNTMIGHLLSLQETQPEYYTDEIIKGLIVNIVLAGTDSSAVALEWAMSDLLNHPEVLKKARAELEDQLSSEHLINELDLTKLPFLQNTILETLRLHPTAPLLMPHFSSHDCTIEGYNISRDTMLLVNAWAIHRDPGWWDDPTSFKPERLENMGHTTYKFMPFGLGRRACPGGGLAQRVISLTLASLIQCFDWKKVDEKEIDMTEGKGLTMPRVVPLEAMCKASSIMNRIFPQAPAGLNKI